MSFQPNQQIYTCTDVNLRATPGYLGNPPPAVLALLPARTVCIVTGAATTADELTWWPVRVALDGGQTVEGWAAETVGENRLLADAPVAPPPPLVQPITPTPVAPPLPRGNRLGFYLHSTNNDSGLWDAIGLVKPPVMLIHEDAANDMLLNEIRAFRAPNALIVGRYYIPNDEQRAMLESSDPAGEGRRFAERILGHDFGKFTKRTADGRLFIDAWMSLNECLPGPASSSYREQPEAYRNLYAAYDRFQVAFRARLQEAGIEAVAFNFAAGNFTEPAHYLDNFPNTLAAYTYLGFHEYGWPSLMPGAGAQTGAGLYHRTVDAMRAQYGPRHRVIITEAGLTRAYGNGQNPDEGWLNQAEPLDENRYWESLAWYNSQLDQDEYVVGACLYQVGHRGDWATFRHLGTDNEGHNLHVVERIAALASAATTRALTTAPRLLPAKRAVLTGKVLFGEKPVAGAVVRLVGDLAQLGSVRGAVWDQPGTVSWSRRVTNFSGSLRTAWDHFVVNEIAGLTWDEFKRQAPIANPALAQSEGRFVADQVYYLPAADGVTPAFLWDSPVTGYSGTLYQAWLDLAQGKVPGMNYASFQRQFAAYNPTFGQHGRRLLANHVYLLPRTVGEDRYTLATTTTTRGRFRFTGVPAGAYLVEIEATGMQRFVADITLETDMDVEIGLEPLLAAASVGQTRGIGGNDFMGVIGREFVVKGRIFRFIGVNLRGLVWYGSGRTGMLQFTNPGHREETVQRAQEMGATVVRVFLPCVNASTEDTIALLRTTLDVVGSHGQYLIPAFVDFYKSTDFRIPGDDQFYQQLDPNFSLELLKGEFYRGGYQERYLPFVRAVVDTFKNDARIFAWEIGNELKYEPAHQDPGRAAFLAFMHNVANEIKRIDANHLVTTGMISTSHASLDEGDLWRQLYGGAEFDFLTVHCYNEEYAGKQDHDFARALDKPFIIEEAGFGKGRPGDRVEQIRRDMDRWFGFGASGYMQWGFMPVNGDIGDGDDDAGMDHKWHGGDFDGLFNLYRERAATLKAQADSMPQPAQPTPRTPPTPPMPANFSTGQQVFALDWVNVRKSAGHVDKPSDDVLGTIAPSAPATISGAATPVAGLTWWPVHTILSTGQTVDGWAAETVNGVQLLGLVQPPPQTPRAASTRGLRGEQRGLARTSQPRGAQARGAFAAGQTLFTAAVVNLRQSPGYVDKASDHVIGQIPYGAALTILEGPATADGLTWWGVRGPLLDNSVATGWVAESDASGQRLLETEPPLSPENASPDRMGPPFQIGETVQVVAASANVRRSPGYINQPPEHVAATVALGTTVTVVGGVQATDGLEWWPITGAQAGDPALTGWVAEAAPDGQRLLAPTRAGEIRVGKPFIGNFVVSQLWGADPDFYRQFLYGNVPLKGHNGIDFATPMRTPLIAIAEGRVKKVAFEAGGFGHHILLQHAWGETLYAHLDTVELREGASVNLGDVIGFSGNSGNNVIHLHFGVRIYPALYTDGWGGFCDPASFMNPADLIITRSGGGRSTPMAPELPGRRRP